MIPRLDHIRNYPLRDACFFHIDDVGRAEIESALGCIDLPKDHIIAQAGSGHFFDILCREGLPIVNLLQCPGALLLKGAAVGVIQARVCDIEAFFGMSLQRAGERVGLV